MKLMILSLMFLLAALTTAQPDCPVLEFGVELAIMLSPTSSNCFVVAPNISTDVQLTVRNDVYGRYSVTTGGSNFGFSWNAPIDGIYYCAYGGDRIFFEEYVPGATVSVVANKVVQQCFSDYLGYDGYFPPAPYETPETVNKEVYWSSLRYFLHADSFEYQVRGEEAVSLQGAVGTAFRGDPGGDTYASIEVSWFLDGLEKRFLAYMEADATSWRFFEMRVYDQTGEWVEFFDPGVSGELETCYKAANLTISNGQGSEIRFEGLTLAAFLPWNDETAFNECVNVTMSNTTTPLPSTNNTLEPSPSPSARGNTTNGIPVAVNKQVSWSSSRYALHADSFEYQVQGEDPVSLVNGTMVSVDGDPGGDAYASVEITWFLDGLEKRLFAYMEANETSWRVFEMRIYDETEEWVYFYNPEIEGELETCFEANNLTISNGQGSEIRLEGLSLAAFLPWDDESAVLECVGTLMNSTRSPTDTLSNSTAVEQEQTTQGPTSSPSPPLTSNVSSTPTVADDVDLSEAPSAVPSSDSSNRPSRADDNSTLVPSIAPSREPTNTPTTLTPSTTAPTSGAAILFSGRSVAMATSFAFLFI